MWRKSHTVDKVALCRKNPISYNYQGTHLIKRLFWYLDELIANFENKSHKASNLVQNGNFSILSLFC